MFPTSVDILLKEIASFMDRNPHLNSQMKDRIQTLQMELGFLKMFMWLLPRRSLRKSYIRAAVAIGKRKLGLYGISDHAVSKLLQEVELCKQKIRVDCHQLFDFSSHCICKFSSVYELIQFIECTMRNLRNLVRFKSGGIVPVRMQVKVLIKKLRILRDFVKTSKQWLLSSIDIREWAFKVACLSTLYWIDHKEEAMASQMKAVLSELLEMAKSCSPEVIKLWLLNASELSTYDRFKMGKFIENFVNFILPLGYMKVLRVKLTFLIAFLMDPPQYEMDANGDNLFLSEVKAVASEIPSLICSLTAGEMNENTVEERNAVLGNFQERACELMAEVRKLFILHPHSSKDHFPITNALGFLDLFMENFGNLMDTLITKVGYIPFAKDQLLTLHKELVSLGPTLKEVQQLQNQLEELEDLRMRINDAVYHVEYVIDSCQMTDFPIWYNVICLSYVIEEMKFINREVQEIMHKQTLNIGVLNAKVTPGRIHLNQANILRTDEIVDLFKDEEEKITNRLIGGSMKLEIISIVGMPGQGKTTLAKKVYNSPSVRYHFNRFGWCFVSHAYEEKMLLLNILRDIDTTLDDKVHYMSKEDLSFKLYRCLKGHMYLIIMDDIWDITAWNALRESFPDDNNGSRILFTSRNDFGCNPLLLRPLSEEKSMELLKHKLFCKDGWPSSFSSDAQKIHKICNGLPLAVVVVAGLLNRASNNLDLWRETVQNLDSRIASEGCVDILELSYNNLPGFLKPSFLYLGVVEQTKVFKVQNLIQLWIAEGFVRKTEKKSFEDVAMEYLEGLIARSLVIVNKKSFASGVVKECRIHDLLHEFCLRKAEEERLMHFPIFSPSSLKAINFEQYRLCFRGWMTNARTRTKSTSPIVRSLLIQCSLYRLDTSWFLSLRLLRVLDLGIIYFYRAFPEEIGSLIFLRYLAIRYPVRVIPSSIGNLCNLESFHVAISENILKLPQTIWKMTALRNMAVVGRGAFVLNDCDANMCGQLENLDSFSSLYLSNVEEAEKLLRGFPNVRKLKMVFSSESWDCRKNSDQGPVLHSLRRLESLSLHFSWNATHTCALDFPRTLKELTLSKLNCPWSQISSIGKLPNLEVLKFLNDAIVGGGWDVGDEEFLRLKYLKLSRLNICYWESPESSFPSLEQLVVRDCPFLVELPSIFLHVVTLKMIEIDRCPEGLGTSAKSTLDEQRDIGNEDLEVLISNELECKQKDLAFSILHPRTVIPSWWIEEDEFSCLTVQEHPELEKEDVLSYRERLELDKDDVLSYGEHLELNKEEILSYVSCFKKRSVPTVRRTDLSVGEHLELDKKVVPRSVSCFKKRCVPNVKRTKFVVKHNCQSRQAIMSRDSKEELKRDG